MTVRRVLTIILYLALAVSSYFLFSVWVGVWVSGMMLLFSIMIGDLMTWISDVNDGEEKGRSVIEGLSANKAMDCD